MKYYAGLDISMEATSICIVDADGTVVREGTVDSTPETIIAFLKNGEVTLDRIGLEACPLSEWIFDGLAEQGCPVVCLETRHLKALLKSGINKTDRDDARGIAQVVRVNLFKPVHVKTRIARRYRALLSARRLVVAEVCRMENHLRGTLKAFGLKVGSTTRRTFDGRVRGLVIGEPGLELVADVLLDVRRWLLARLDDLDRRVLRIVRNDPVCRRLMTAPGIGPVTALTYRTAMDAPARFMKSRTVGAYFGLTPRRYQSGEIDHSGRISKVGDGTVRAALYEAATVLLRRNTRPSALKSWGLAIYKRRGRRKSVVAVVRKLAVILHRLWTGNETFRWSAA